MSIGIIGYGFVGKAVGQLSVVRGLKVYDPNIEEFSSMEDQINAYNCDIVFINVPTNLKDGNLDTSILESCFTMYKELNKHDSTIVVKSTIPVGTCRKLSRDYNLDNVVFNPEFLTERTAMQDFINEKELYLSGPEKHTNKVKQVYVEFYNYHKNFEVQMYEVEEWEEIELLKLARNTFYSVKVSYCNHLYNLCERKGIDYSNFRKHFARAEWVGEQHTMVPGPDGKFGYGGKCLPKDSTELLNFCKKQDIMFEMLEKSIDFNILQRSKKV